MMRTLSSFLLLSTSSTIVLASSQRNLRISPARSEPAMGKVQLLRTVAIDSLAVFDDPDSYQNQALRYVQQERMLTPDDAEFLIYYGLACLYYGTYAVHNKHTVNDFGGEFQLSGWNEDEGWLSTTVDKCQWYGITCNSDNEVLVLELDSNNMFGTFPPEVEHFGASLETIDLYNNPYLSTEGDAGNAWMGKLPKLRALFFRTTSFEYNGIPTFWSGSTTLEQIDCSNTFFSNGPIRPEAFVDLPSLWYLDIGTNIYTGDFLPETLLNLPSLRQFYMPEAEFVDTPIDLKFLTKMPVIGQVFMDYVAVDSTIPPELGEVSTLYSLAISNAGLMGPIPKELANLENLNSLYLQANNLTGEIPTELGLLKSMEYMYMHDNDLDGMMPSQVCFNRDPVGVLVRLGSDCVGDMPEVACNCCTCCDTDQCNEERRRAMEEE